MTKESTQKFWDSLEILEKQHWISRDFNGRGDFLFSGMMRFAGHWKGSITSDDSEAHLCLQRSANVSGSISVARLSVECHLKDVEIEADVFHALPGSKIFGRIRAGRIIVDEGAIVQGRILSDSSLEKNFRSQRRAV